MGKTRHWEAAAHTSDAEPHYHRPSRSSGSQGVHSADASNRRSSKGRYGEKDRAMIKDRRGDGGGVAQRMEHTEMVGAGGTAELLQRSGSDTVRLGSSKAEGSHRYQREGVRDRYHTEISSSDPSKASTTHSSGSSRAAAERGHSPRSRCVERFRCMALH